MKNFEKEIAEKIYMANGLSLSKLGLRFDKVVVHLLGNLRAFVESDLSDGEVVLMTITAPIKVPVKTENKLKEQIKDFLKTRKRYRDRTLSVFQNSIRLRVISPSSKMPTRFAGFVHNPGTDDKMLLDLASRWFLQ